MRALGLGLGLSKLQTGLSGYVRERPVELVHVDVKRLGRGPDDGGHRMLGANRQNDKFWERTLENLARSTGVADPHVVTAKVCVDKRRQWRYVRNIRGSIIVSTAVGTVTAPVRCLRRRGTAGS